MTARFDPSFAPYMEGEFTGSVTVADHPALGFGNLVINPADPFEISVDWRTFGALNPLWLTALSVASPNWVVTAYAEPVGTGAPVRLAQTSVAVASAAPFGASSAYHATLTVAAGTLAEENPASPAPSGIYRIAVTVFLDSALGGLGFDITGYTEGPAIKVENPV